MKKLLFIFLIIICVDRSWAGTDVKARLKSTAYKEAWVDVEAFVSADHLRLNFKGPWSRGSLIYDKATSLLTLVDDFGKIIIPISETDQTALKWMGIVTASKLKDEMDGALPSIKLAYNLVVENALALFNGVPVLKEQGVRMGSFTCDHYQTDGEGTKNREVWMTNLEQTTMSREDYDTLQSLMRLMVDICGPVLKEFGAETETFQQENSDVQLPVLMVLYAKGKPSSRFKILGIRSRTFPFSTFDPPAGYQTLGLLELIKQAIKENP